ncbi:hypothetical protein Sjap_018251 [Stephania japonica]|uniref:Uncharacterized protein n=1 Tax=Stephania japonica TaxID=461633 RepID=A0AAP0I8B7_9MAGN
MASSSSPCSLLLLFLSLSLFFSVSTSTTIGTGTGTLLPLTSSIDLDVVDLEHPVLEVSPSPLVRYPSRDGAKDALSCSRVRLAGLSRLNIRSYFNSIRVTVTPSRVIPERLHNRIAICFHRNASFASCQCGNDDWGTLQKGNWSAFMSPYEDKYLDLKFSNGLSGTLTVSIEEVFHQWRLVVLILGFGLLLLAPILSDSIPFYYSSSMAIGVLLVVLIILFQGMKLLPTCRKNIFYLTIYGSLVGVGSFIVHYFSMMVNSILQNLGLSEDMYNPVSVFLLAGIILAGAALGYWIVGKFIISEDGGVDASIAQFVKWAMRTMAMTFIYQSSRDTFMAAAAAAVALAWCWGINFLISTRWRSQRQLYQGNESPWLRRANRGSTSHNRTEFLSRSTEISPRQKLWNSPKRSYAWSDSPTKGLVLSSPSNGATVQKDYYSTFHKTPTRKRYSKKMWDEFTRESTREALVELASSPEFTDWIVDNVDRLKIDRSNSDDSVESESDSSDETAVDNGNRRNFLKWY